MIRLSTQTPLDGDVQVRDAENPTKVAAYKANGVVSLGPLNRSGDMSVECEIFGFRKQKQVINFDNPTAAEAVSIDSGRVVVPFALSRLKKGDIAVMYNVYFFKDGYAA